MGLFKKWSGCGCGCSSPTVVERVVEKVVEVEREPEYPLPDPEQFQIINAEEYGGKYVIAEIVYPGCTNYEGRKICLFDATYKELKRHKFLDPHFCEGDHISPLARFVPTEDGWEMARILACKLTNTDASKRTINFIRGLRCRKV